MASVTVTNLENFQTLVTTGEHLYLRMSLSTYRVRFLPTLAENPRDPDRGAGVNPRALSEWLCEKSASSCAGSCLIRTSRYQVGLRRAGKKWPRPRGNRSLTRTARFYGRSVWRSLNSANQFCTTWIEVGLSAQTISISTNR